MTTAITLTLPPSRSLTALIQKQIRSYVYQTKTCLWKCYLRFLLNICIYIYIHIHIIFVYSVCTHLCDRNQHWTCPPFLYNFSPASSGRVRHDASLSQKTCILTEPLPSWTPNALLEFTIWFNRKIALYFLNILKRSFNFYESHISF